MTGSRFSITPQRSATRRFFPAAAEGWHSALLGMRHEYGGRGYVGHGIDCLGVVLRFFWDHGFSVPDPESIEPLAVVAGLRPHFVRAHPPDFGDVAEFVGDDGHHHLAVVLFDKLLHCHGKRGVEILPCVPDAAAFYRLRGLGGAR